MELWDVYDANRNKTGKITDRYSNNNLKKGEYHLVVHVCIFNKNKEMLIQKRSSSKDKYPNMWDITVGGSAIKGEDSRDAIKRELMEELGIDYNFTEVQPRITLNFNEGFDDIFIINKDVNLKELKFQKEEVQDAKWASKDEIINLINNNKFVPHYAELINLLFKYREEINEGEEYKC